MGAGREKMKFTDSDIKKLMARWFRMARYNEDQIRNIQADEQKLYDFMHRDGNNRVTMQTIEWWELPGLRCMAKFDRHLGPFWPKGTKRETMNDIWNIFISGIVPIWRPILSRLGDDPTMEINLIHEADIDIKRSGVAIDTLMPQGTGSGKKRQLEEMTKGGNWSGRGDLD